MTTLDDVARQLREWRISAGSPSYAELARGVGDVRATAASDAPLDPRLVAPGRVTVYDCFRDGRTRIDLALVLDLARVLGIEGREYDAWRDRCARAMRPEALSGLVTTSTVFPRPAEPGLDTTSGLGGSGRLLFAGIGGSGKTQAAARLLSAMHRAGDIDSVLTIRLDGPEATLAAILNAAAHELSIRLPEDPARAATRLMAVLSRRRIALLVDDVVGPEQVSALVSAPATGPLLATSRQALDIPGLTRIDLPPWSPDQVASYITDVVGRDRTGAEPEATATLAELTGGLPLVVALVAARVRATPDWSLADHVAALLERRAGDRIEDAVRASMGAVHAALSPAARELWALLASGPRSGLTSASIGASIQGDPTAAVTELKRAYLLQRGDHRHHLHDIARSYARGRALDEDPPSVRARRQDRLIDRLGAEAWAVARSLAPSDFEAARCEVESVEIADSQAWLTGDLPGALELAREVRDRRPDAVINLSEAVATSLERTGLVGFSDQLHAAAREAAVAADDAIGEARARCALAISAVRRDELDVPLDEIAASATRQGDTWTLARLGNLRGIMAMKAGDEPEALRQFREAHQLAASAGQLALAPAIAGNLALALAYAGDLDEALRWNRDSLAGALEVGNIGLAATTSCNMSETERLLGHPHEAVRSAQEGVQYAEQIGDRLGLTHALVNLGKSLTLSGRPDEAIHQLERAERSAADLELVEIEATVHVAVGEALLATGDSARAGDRFRAAVEAHNDSPIDPATALHHLGQIAAVSNPAQARCLYDQALERLGDGFDAIAAAIRADRQALDQRP